MWILFFLFLAAEPKGKPKSLIHDARFAILRRPLSSIHVRFKGRYSRDAEWIFEFASLPVRFPNFLCAVILSFFDSHIGCCRYAYTIGILIYTSDEFFRLPLEYRDTNLFIVPLTRLVSFLFPFLFFFLFSFFSLFTKSFLARKSVES